MIEKKWKRRWKFSVIKKNLWSGQLFISRTIFKYKNIIIQLW
jgi:hypothetical protein